MRTTMNLPDGLMAELKARAAQERRTVTSLVEEGLRALLAQPPAPADPRPLPSWHGGELLVDISDRDALWAALDDRQ